MTFYYRLRGRFVTEKQYKKWKQRQAKRHVNLTFVFVPLILQPQPKPKTGTLLDYMEGETV